MKKERFEEDATPEIGQRGPLFRDYVLSGRERKNLAILDTIRKRGPVSRTEITRLTGLNIVTVSHYVDNYVRLGLVYEKGYAVSTGGRKPTLVELNSKAFYVAGVDVGPNTITGVVIDLSANVISRMSVPRPKGLMDEVLERTVDLVRTLIKNSGINPKQIKGVGMGVSGVVDAQASAIRDTDGTRGSSSVSYATIRTKFEPELGMPVFVGNDATVAAYGERWLGLDLDIENMIFIYSDVGLGIIIKGDIYTGAGGSAGEVQINTLSEEMKELEPFLKNQNFLRPWGGSDCGVTAGALEAIKQGKETKISEFAKKADAVNFSAVAKAAKAGDEVAKELIEKAAINLGVRAAVLVNLFNPEVVVVGGGVEEAGELLLGSVRKIVKALAFEEPASIVKVVPARLGELSVSLGAGLLVMREVFSEI